MQQRDKHTHQRSGQMVGNLDGQKHVIVFGDMPPSEGSHDGTDGITVAYTWCVPGRVPFIGAERSDITGSI